jgi:hypothetical protein
MIIALKEITEWNTDYKQPNHTYLVDHHDNVIAYKKWHKGEPIFSTRKFLLNKRYRKFVEVDPAQFKYTTLDTNANTKIVIGSKGDKYLINFDEKTCSCNGFKFRGKCKHLCLDN